jgi:hypothetical protein
METFKTFSAISIYQDVRTAKLFGMAEELGNKG